MAEPQESRSAEAIAAHLIAAYDRAAFVNRIATHEPDFGVDTAYEVLQHIERDRHRRGWRPVGRKIGFTNQTIWARYGVSGPMWARMWDRTVRFATAGAAEVGLDDFVQPRIEPEVVFGLRDAVAAGGEPLRLLSSVEWMAAGFEIVQCPFPDWRFDAAECTAAFGLHGALVVGTPTPLRDLDLARLATTLAAFTLTLSRAGRVVERGNGANVLGSPALALDYLARELGGQTRFEPLAAGEIVTTGTLTDAQPVNAGDRWSSDYGDLGVESLSVTFTTSTARP
jgi:2-oxo-3-hexenedioate decarboxylase